ncbi:MULTISPECIES: MFS transporter [Pseudomonas]|uniref:MFS transporter n=1 Tax=Pseudomonas syringae pv. papulans TaxID=83963 RepID=A0AA43IV64_PSESX|nr:MULTISPECIES: MFS transporter [Pseudomonas]KWS32815.1 permease [Pseudomonas syringae pv. papulans]MBD8710249.1 MFS transporter [Pseudomonas sp. CFBP 13711]MBD8715518.1 MFS transporter [Pseudomonas sp. CFBP 13715]MDH4606307.1 MFS transporter [Pseudomonas syringae pv. papulans]MDH4623146.1 MFS transporter [Pseudomonas syringae pv. papulans]
MTSHTSTPSALAAFTLLAIACLTIMVGCVIVPGLPRIAGELGIDHGVGLLVTLPALGVVLFGPIAGRLVDRFGLYNSLMAGLIAYGALGMAGAAIHGPWAVYTDRLCLGAATAVIMSSGTGLISALYTGSARLTMIARQGMSIELGGVVFLFIGGLLATIGWAWPFVLYLVAWIFAAMLFCFVPRLQHSPQERGDEGGRDAAVPQSLKIVFTAAVMSMLCFFTGIIVLPIALRELGLNEAQTGYFLSFISLIAVGAAAMMPRFVNRIGEHRTIAIAFACYAVAHVVFAIGDGLSIYLGGAIALGAGFGLSVPLVNHMTIEQSHSQLRGRNLAYLSMAIFFGQFISAGMELIPGNPEVIFSSAAALGLVSAVLLLAGHQQQRAHLG